MITPFQIGILVFLGLSILLMMAFVKSFSKFISKMKDLVESNLKSNKSSVNIQSSVESVIREANKRTKELEELVVDLEGKLVTAQENEKRALKAKEDYTRIIKEDKVLYPNYGLVWTEQKEEFTVNFECDVLEVSEKKAKIRPYAASSSNKRWNDLSDDDKNDPKGTFRHIYEKWVPLEKLELIIDLGRN